MPTKEVKIIEKVQSNFELYMNLVKSIDNKEVREGLVTFCEAHAARIAACPASTNTKYIGAFTGGLVWHSLEVLKAMKELNRVYDANISKDSLIVTALFHDIGKIGAENEDYYLAQESEWHAKRGMLFEINPELGNVPVCVRSLWWLNSEICLSVDEIQAISSLQHINNMYSSEVYNAPMLTMILQQAVRACCNKNKGQLSVIE